MIPQNVARHPHRCPTSAPNGTPSALATVSPANITATVREAGSGPASRRATSEPMPKKVPWQRAATIRPSSSTG